MMQFFDCNLSYGPEVAATQVKGCASIAELKTHLNRAGIAGGLVIKSMVQSSFCVRASVRKEYCLARICPGLTTITALARCFRLISGTRTGAIFSLFNGQELLSKLGHGKR